MTHLESRYSLKMGNVSRVKDFMEQVLKHDLKYSYFIDYLTCNIYKCNIWSPCITTWIRLCGVYLCFPAWHTEVSGDEKESDLNDNLVLLWESFCNRQKWPSVLPGKWFFFSFCELFSCSGERERKRDRKRKTERDPQRLVESQALSINHTHTYIQTHTGV